MVAAHVQEEHMTQAVSPVPTLRPAVLKFSLINEDICLLLTLCLIDEMLIASAESDLVDTVPAYRVSKNVAKDAKREKKTPKPRTTP